MTPLEIHVMLFHAVRVPGEGKRGLVFDEPRSGVSAAAEEDFATRGLLCKLADGTFEITDGGRMYVEALCSVPLPEMRWTMPERAWPNEGLSGALRGLRRGWDQAVSETDVRHSNGDPARMGVGVAQGLRQSMCHCAKCGGEFKDVEDDLIECLVCGRQVQS